jgi:hypothetical protein
MYDMSLQPPLFEKLLLIESGNYNPGVYPIGHKLSGRLRPYPGKMPWMFEAWTNGLRLLNEIINEKKL